MIRVFNQYGNRKNKNKARLKFVLRERGFEWLQEQIEKEYADILANGGIASPELVPEGFGGYQSQSAAAGQGALLPVVHANGTGDAEYDRWLETNVRNQRRPATPWSRCGSIRAISPADQLRGLARIASDAGDGLVRIMIDQNLLLGFIPLGRVRGVYAALDELGLAGSGAREIEDVTTCPGAYSCNLALTKSMNLGAALQEAARHYDDPLVRKLSIKVSGCPNSCGQHWIADFGFYGNARKIDGKRSAVLPDAAGRRLRRRGRHALRPGGAERSGAAGARSGAAHSRSLPGQPRRGETFREYVMRYKVEILPRAHQRSGQARRTRARNLPGLGRRHGLLAASSAAASAPRKSRAVKPST